MRNFLLTAVLAAASLFGGVTQAAEFQAGKEYVELSSPVPVADPSKIEVVELFWYGCPHCYQFEPVIKPWAEAAGGCAVQAHPAMFGGIWNAHGQLFVTLESMGVEPKVHDAVFAAYHQERKKLATPEEMADFLEGHGVDKQASRLTTPLACAASSRRRNSAWPTRSPAYR